MVSTFIDAIRPVTPTITTSEGGQAYEADPWTRFRRFNLIGTTGGTFYVNERDLTLDNIEVVRACLAEDGPRAVRELLAIGDGRAPKHDPVLFTLAIASTAADKATRDAAFAAVPALCRTATHLMHWVAYREALGAVNRPKRPAGTTDAEYGRLVQAEVDKRVAAGDPFPYGGWGRGVKDAVAAWFTTKTADQLAYQAIKYPSRDGWSLRDLLRLTKPKTGDPALNAVFGYIAHGYDDERMADQPLPTQVHMREFLHRDPTWDQAANKIREYRMPREAIPSQLLNDPLIWDALLADMPITAMIRNLGKMSAVGLLTEGSDAARTVRDRLEDADRLRKGRVHPISVLNALKVYEQGHGDRGSLTWRAVKKVVTALDEAFYLAFGAVEPTGTRLLAAIDVSGSMEAAASGMVNMTCREVAAAMALVTAATEPNAKVLAFDTGLYDPEIRPTMRLDEVRRIVNALPGGGTDCSVPIRWARDSNTRFDAIVLYTDAETRKPDQARTLEQYRGKVNRQARNVQVMAAPNRYSLADPRNPLDLDVVGFDANVPAVIAEFVSGRL
jgi:60 kDa SS-A/Ro ribonucleoprotein